MSASIGYRLKILGQRLWGEKSFTEFLKSKYGENWEQHKEQTETEIKFHINDLAERRNAISHGSDFDILSLDIILDYANSLKVFSLSIFNILEKCLLPYFVKEHGFKLGSGFVVHVNKVIELGTVEQTIKVGNFIASKSITTDEFLDYGKIIEVRRNGTTVTEINEVPCRQCIRCRRF